MPKASAKTRIPNWLEAKEPCVQCGQLTRLAIHDPKDQKQVHICSDNCQTNYALQVGHISYNQVRDHDSPMKFESIGKLNELTADEIKRQFKFKHKLTTAQMNRNKQGDPLDRMFKAMGLRLPKNKKRKNISTRMPFTYTIDEVKELPW